MADHRLLFVAARHRTDAAVREVPLHELVEPVPVALLEGRPLRLAVIGEDDELVRPRGVAAGPLEAAELLVELPQSLERVMALEAGVPVIPVAMIGTDRVNPIGSRMWRPHKVNIKIGEPLDFSRYHGMAGDRFIERSMTDEIMYALMELTGQTYVDMYAASVKERAAALAAAPPPEKRAS
jgi:hypothetical protein